MSELSLTYFLDYLEQIPSCTSFVARELNVVVKGSGR